jgi:hypothetical protein
MVTLPASVGGNYPNLNEPSFTDRKGGHRDGCERRAVGRPFEAEIVPFEVLAAIALDDELDPSTGSDVDREAVLESAEPARRTAPELSVSVTVRIEPPASCVAVWSPETVPRTSVPETV